MGKATVVSGGTDGMYTIQPVHNRDRLDSEIARIESVIADLEAARIDIQSAVADGEDAVASAKSILDEVIEIAIETGDTSSVAAAVKNISLAASFRNEAESRLALNTAQLATERLELSRLQAVPADVSQSAWCADYTENLSGDIATAEIPGEGNARIIVRPGYNGEAAYSATRDGQLFHREGMSPAQAFFNAAILPGWQKWQPTYRVGTLTSVDEAADTGNVTLSSEQSSAQGLGVNQSTTLTAVPIVYMECNAEAFQVGDRVLVEFTGQNWGAPKVIGFESNPQECVGWPEAVEFSVSIDTDTFTQTGELEFVARIRADFAETCCGYSERRTENVRTRKKTLAYAGENGVWFTFESMGGAFPENTDFELVNAASYADRVVIDELWEHAHQGNTGGSSYGYPGTTDERNEAVSGGGLAHCRVSGSVGWTSAPRTLWSLQKSTGYQQIDLTNPGTLTCSDAPIPLWAGRRDGFNSLNVSGTITVTEETAATQNLNCISLIPLVAFTQTNYLGQGSAGQAGADFADVAAFAQSKSALPASVSVRKTGTSRTKTYVLEGVVGGNSWENIRFIREDLAV